MLLKIWKAQQSCLADSSVRPIQHWVSIASWLKRDYHHLPTRSSNSWFFLLECISHGSMHRRTWIAKENSKKRIFQKKNWKLNSRRRWKSVALIPWRICNVYKLNQNMSHIFCNILILHTMYSLSFIQYDVCDSSEIKEG